MAVNQQFCIERSVRRKFQTDLWWHSEYSKGGGSRTVSRLPTVEYLSRYILCIGEVYDYGSVSVCAVCVCGVCVRKRECVCVSNNLWGDRGLLLKDVCGWLC